MMTAVTEKKKIEQEHARKDYTQDVENYISALHKLKFGLNGYVNILN